VILAAIPQNVCTNQTFCGLLGGSCMLLLILQLPLFGHNRFSIMTHRMLCQAQMPQII